MGRERVKLMSIEIEDAADPPEEPRVNVYPQGHGRYRLELPTLDGLIDGSMAHKPLYEMLKCLPRFEEDA